jgi:hypothetical protein
MGVLELTSYNIQMFLFLESRSVYQIGISKKDTCLVKKFKKKKKKVQKEGVERLEVGSAKQAMKINR